MDSRSSFVTRPSPSASTAAPLRNSSVSSVSARNCQTNPLRSRISKKTRPIPRLKTNPNPPPPPTISPPPTPPPQNDPDPTPSPDDLAPSDPRPDSDPDPDTPPGPLDDPQAVPLVIPPLRVNGTFVL